MPELYERIFELALNRSFFMPSNEPYGSVSGFYDYGPVGKLIKNKIEALWRRMFIREEEAHEVETSTITPEIVLKASGHVDSFADPIVECKLCKMRYRADTLVESKIKKGVALGGEALWQWDGKLPTLDSAITENGIRCNCKGELTNARMFNLMFKTEIGGDAAPAYCRPETAQGIFTSFPRLFRNHGAKLPLAVAQIGKSFRNEISPRKSLVRMREFTQMELEYFFNPNNTSINGFDKLADTKMRFKINDKIEWKTTGEAVSQKLIPNEIFAYFLAKEWQFYKLCGLQEDKMYFRLLRDDERPHYSKCNVDLEVETSHGAIEINGNAYRTDFDLSQHSKFSKQDMAVFVEEEKKKIMPHVFEASLGVDRLFFCILEHCFRDKQNKTENSKLETVKEWDWFDLPTRVAPYEFALFPLMKKDGLAEKARDIYDSLKSDFNIFYQESGGIGKRYARADEIGCVYACTVDYDALKDNSVTIRYRNDGKQERIKISVIKDKITENIASARVTL